MAITSQITVSVKPEFYKSTLKMGGLEPGNTLKLKIIGLQGDRALIDLGNFRTTADIKIPVTLGEELTVKVLEAGRQLKLGVINSDQKNPGVSEAPGQRRQAPPAENLNKIGNELSRILNHAADLSGDKKSPSSIFNVLARLNSYFEPFELKEIMAELLPRLKSHFENSGIFFEKSLERIISQALEEKDGPPTKSLADLSEIKAVFSRDLKPNLLLLQHFLEGKETLQKIFDPNTLAVLKGAVDSLLADITRQQGRAVTQLESTDPFQVFVYTLPLKEGDQAAKLKIFYEKKQKSGRKEGFQISLLLSMNRLGDVRTDFFLLGNDLNLTFYVTEPSTKIAIQDNFRELDDLLHDLFDQVQLKVMVSDKKVKDFDRPDVQMTGNHKVDLRI
jgi:hypothetical protein